MYLHALEDPDSGVTDAITACSLIEVVLVNCRGKIDGIIPTVLDLTLAKLRDADFNHLKVSLLVVIANSLYYNPLLTLQYFSEKNITTEIFDVWFRLLNTSFKRTHEIKLTILGLSAIFHVPFSTWPPILQSQLKIIVTALMELCKKFMILLANKSKGDTSSDSDGDGDEDEVEVDEVDETVKDESALKAFKKDVNKYKKKKYTTMTKM